LVLHFTGQIIIFRNCNSKHIGKKLVGLAVVESLCSIYTLLFGFQNMGAIEWRDLKRVDAGLDYIILERLSEKVPLLCSEKMEQIYNL